MVRSASIFLALAGAASAFTAQPPAAPRRSTNLDASRRDFLVAGAAAVPAALLSSPAFAADKKKKNAPLPTPPTGVEYSGVYTDPNHPAGYRVVRATEKKGEAVIVLQDDPKSEVITVKAKSKAGKVKKGEKGQVTTLAIDFSVKGGPKDLPGTASNGVITFPDGNSWKKAGGIDGVYFDPNHPKGYRVVKVKKDGKVCVELQNDPAEQAVELVGKMRQSGFLFVDFSPKGGPKYLAASFKGDKLTFTDGNSWTKL